MGKVDEKIARASRSSGGRKVKPRGPCGKVLYPSRGEAEARLREVAAMPVLSLASARKPGSSVAYRCRGCKAWHIGHSLDGKPFDLSIPLP